MPRSGIRFFSEQTDFALPHPRVTSRWLSLVARKEKASIRELNYIFCNDAVILGINREFLKHDTYTDIITFDNSEVPRTIEADVFISVDRVLENSGTFRATFDEELHRVMVHGVLHLVGYSDKTVSAKRLMKKKEDAYLSLR